MCKKIVRHSSTWLVSIMDLHQLVFPSGYSLSCLNEWAWNTHHPIWIYISSQKEISSSPKTDSTRNKLEHSKNIYSFHQKCIILYNNSRTRLFHAKSVLTEDAISYCDSWSKIESSKATTIANSNEIMISYEWAVRCSTEPYRRQPTKFAALCEFPIWT